MRIFFFNAYFNPDRYEGSRIHIEQLVCNLIELGHEVWVQPASPVTQAYKLPQDRVARLLQLRRMDVFYFRIAGKPLALPYYMRHPLRNFGFEKKYVWEINAASDYSAFLDNFVDRSMRAKLDSELTNQAQLVDLAICNTEGLAKFAFDLGIKNSKVIPLGTTFKLFGSEVFPTPYVSRLPNQLNVVWIGNSQAPWHDFETIRKTTWTLRNDKNIRFYLIGEYPSNLQFADNVIYKGSIPYKYVPSYLKAMDVGLALYKDASWSRYGVFSSPLKLFDYFAAGLVVMASPIEQVRKCIEHEKTGYIIPFGDHVALAERLRFIAEHKFELKQMGEYMRSQVINYFNWKRVAKETEDALLKIP